MPLIDRLQELYDERLEHEKLKASFPKAMDYDRTGSGTSGQLRAERFLGIAEAVLKKSVQSFRQRLALAVELKLSLLKRSANGEPIDNSYLSLLCYQDIFNALAAERLDLAESLCHSLRVRTTNIDQQLDVFDQKLGAMMIALVLDLPDLSKRIEELEAVCRQSDNADFAGYAMVAKGIVQQSQTISQEGLRQIEQGHKKQSKRGGIFHGFEDEVLCVWGIGMSNLARYRGIQLSPIPPLLPEELVRRSSAPSSGAK